MSRQKTKLPPPPSQDRTEEPSTFETYLMLAVGTAIREAIRDWTSLTKIGFQHSGTRGWRKTPNLKPQLSANRSKKRPRKPPARRR